MKGIVILLAHLLTTVAKLLGPGGGFSTTHFARRTGLAFTGIENLA